MPANVVIFLVLCVAIASLVVGALALSQSNDALSKTQNIASVDPGHTTFRGVLEATQAIGVAEAVLTYDRDTLTTTWDVGQHQIARIDVIAGDLLTLQISNVTDGFTYRLTAYLGVKANVILPSTTILLTSNSEALSPLPGAVFGGPIPTIQQTSVIDVQASNGFLMMTTLAIPCIESLRPTLWYSVRSSNYYTLKDNGTLDTLLPLGASNFVLQQNGPDASVSPMGNTGFGINIASTDTQFIASNVPISDIRTGDRATTWFCVLQNLAQASGSVARWQTSDGTFVQILNGKETDPGANAIFFQMTDGVSFPDSIGGTGGQTSLFTVIHGTFANGSPTAVYAMYDNNSVIDIDEISLVTINSTPGDFMINASMIVGLQSGLIGDVLVFNYELSLLESHNVVSQLASLYGVKEFQFIV